MAINDTTASPSSASSSPSTTALTPDFRLPVAIVVLGALLFFVSLWLCAIVVLFGLFLSFQTTRIRLGFGDSSLKVYTGDREIRDFPYDEWLNWEIFWSPLPILFYFKEVNSIHFVPVIFDVTELKQALETHVPKIGLGRR